MADPFNPNCFTDNPLDRAALKRSDPDWVAEALADPDSAFVPLWRLNPFFVADGEDGLAIGWVTKAALAAAGADRSFTVLLGVDDGRAHFAVDVSKLEAPQADGPFAGLGEFMDLRQSVPRITGRDASILAQAKSMIDWHRRHGYCAACGAATALAEAGYRRDCAQCGAQHFPRTDPVVISVVVDGERCLLGRNAQFPGPMFSALAGFVEPGESIEEAVAREVFEEVGIQVGRVRYHSAQPWPYPSSLMIGCMAQAASTEITLDPKEISEARWFTRDQLRGALLRAADPGFDMMRALSQPDRPDTDFFIPPPMAIAHQLIKAWVEED